MEISSINSDIIRGNVTTIILGSLWSNDRYGYDILKEIENKSDNQYKLKQPTLYSQLKRLEKQGLISSYEGSPDDTGGGRRRYYSLTDEGRTYLEKEKKEYEYSRTILDKLVSSQEFDFEKDNAPFDTTELRPYAKRNSDSSKPKTKIVYKDKIVEVEKIVEKKIFLDVNGNELNHDEIAKLKSNADLNESNQIQNINLNNDEDTQIENTKIKDKDTLFADNLKAQNITKIEKDNEITNSEIAEKIDNTETAEINKKVEEVVKIEKPKKRSQNLKQLFDKLEAQKDKEILSRQENISVANGESETSYFSSSSNSESNSNSLKDIFKTIEKKSKDDNKLTKNNIDTAQQLNFDNLLEKEEFIESKIENSTIKGRFKEKSNLEAKKLSNSTKTNFDFEKEEVNYKDFFSSITPIPEEKTELKPIEKKNSSNDNELKTRLYAEGFKIRPYDKGNSSEYYTFNFIQSNRINRDCFFGVLAVFIVEIAIMWLSLMNQISYVYFLSAGGIGTFLCLIPLIIYFINPRKRTRANFNFRLSLLNRTMMFIELTVVCVLIGFFALGANINDLSLIYKSIILPMIMLTNFPLSSFIYCLLYKTKKYHIA